MLPVCAEPGDIERKALQQEASEGCPAEMPGGGTQTRLTRQKRLLLEVLREANRPLSVEDIFGRVQMSLPNIAKSTVYRNIDMLLKAGRIERIFLDEKETLYRLAADAGHRHYLVCESCKRMFDLPHCPLHDYEADIARMGFAVKDHFVQITGLCSSCRDQEKEK